MAAEGGTDAARRTALRRMKAGAAALLLVSAGVLATTYLAVDPAHGWVGFVRAAAEAALVGGSADWFAVTALFRRPLGLPIPHTALIPRRKEAIGAGLADFVADHFLSPVVVAARLHEARVAERAARWLVAPGHAAAAAGQLARLLRLGLEEARGDGVHRSEVSALLARAATQRLAAASWAPLAGTLLQGLVADGRHQPVVALILRSSRTWLCDNEKLALRNLARPVPGYVPWFIKDPAVKRVYDRSVALVQEVEGDPGHELRRSLDTLLLDYGRDLGAGGAAAVAFDAFVSSVLAHPQAARSLADVLDSAMRVLAELAEQPDGPVQELVTARLRGLGERLRTDPLLAARVEGTLERLAAGVARTWSGEFTRLITDTVERWDGRETAERIELQVGRDLQFIRINGTVVGALAGVAIHGVAVALGG